MSAPLTHSPLLVASEPDGGQLIGRDPAEGSPAVLRDCYSIENPVKAIRARCLDCCAGSPMEVRKCSAIKCASWPFRQGRNPFRTKRVISEAERARRTAQLNPEHPPENNYAARPWQGEAALEFERRLDDAIFTP